MFRTTMTAAVALVAAIANGPAARADDKCKVVAEITVEAVAKGSMAVCLRSAHPGVCAVATILNQSEAAKSLSKTLTEKGCEFLVEKVGNSFRVTMTGKKADVDAAVKDLKASKDVKVR